MRYSEGLTSAFSGVSGSGGAWSGGVAEEGGVAEAHATEEIQIAVIVDIDKGR